jgi:hypothetical protein
MPLLNHISMSGSALAGYGTEAISLEKHGDMKA